MEHLSWLWSESDADVGMEEGSERCSIAGFENGERGPKPRDMVTSKS